MLGMAWRGKGKSMGVCLGGSIKSEVVGDYYNVLHGVFSLLVSWYAGKNKMIVNGSKNPVNCFAGAVWCTDLKTSLVNYVT